MNHVEEFSCSHAAKHEKKVLRKRKVIKKTVRQKIKNRFLLDSRLVLTGTIVTAHRFGYFVFSKIRWGWCENPSGWKSAPSSYIYPLALPLNPHTSIERVRTLRDVPRFKNKNIITQLQTVEVEALKQALCSTL